MAQTSAGLLMTRTREGQPQFFLVHPGGPFFRKRDEGIWTIPKGLVNPGEDLLACAIREFNEETGIVPQGPFISLESTRMKSGKIIHAWMFEGEWDEESGITSNQFALEWPPGSGKTIQATEADKAIWADLNEARRLIHASQLPFLDRAVDIKSTQAK